ncbi:amidohydrolase [Chitinophaga sp. MD30]|nr:amidohydrolase [Chitinophaga sp. MD30]
MMKKILIYLSFLPVAFSARAQETMYPAKVQQQSIVLTNATLHLGNGKVIEKGTLTFSNGKITAVGTSAGTTANAQVIDLKGQHVYPGLIAPVSTLGLTEVESVRATNDFKEVGEINPSVRSLVAYNADSKVINTLRSNGILLAQVTPEGGLLSGSSSVVQLDAWNWEDAAYRTDGAMHFYMPKLLPTGNPFFASPVSITSDKVKMAMEKIEKVHSFLKEAQAYNKDEKHTTANLQFEALRKLFDRQQKLFIHCDLVKEILIAIGFAKEFNIDVVIVGGADAWMLAGELKQNNIAVVLAQPHSLPVMQDDDVDQPYKTAAQLQKAGVLFCLSNEGFWQQRNLPFNAGTAATYGLTKEEALSAITLNAARILGIDNLTGSLEVGKDANIAISSGDILDMRSHHITQAFIQGREINLDNKHKQLYKRYEYKYGLADQ